MIYLSFEYHTGTVRIILLNRGSFLFFFVFVFVFFLYFIYVYKITWVFNLVLKFWGNIRLRVPVYNMSIQHLNSIQSIQNICRVLAGLKIFDFHRFLKKIILFFLTQVRSMILCVYGLSSKLKLSSFLDIPVIGHWLAAG
jgi:hypothetical protein